MNAVSVALAGIAAPPWRAGLAGLCRRALAAAGIDGWDLSVLLTNDAVIRDLNVRYRGADRPTDVLSFSQADGVRIATAGARRLAGDIVISVETLRRDARERGGDEERELARLVVHGILHLDGMDHGRGRGRAMRDRERRVLAVLAAGSGAKRGRGGT